MLTKPSAELTLFDTLSRLTFVRATKLLGAEGDHLIAARHRFFGSLCDWLRGANSELSTRLAGRVSDKK
jgi:hypothetical protein